MVIWYIWCQILSRVDGEIANGSEDMIESSQQIDPEMLKGRNRRLWHEWHLLEEGLSNRRNITFKVTRRNAEGLPTGYLVYYDLRSICGVTHEEELNEPGVENHPIFARGFQMTIDLPNGYPCVDAPPSLHFQTTDAQGKAIPHPWHPNIRYFGDFAGRVCINMADTYTDLLWGVDRVASYLRYDTYHALMEPPFPEDLKVAAWVIRQGEPKSWIIFEQ